MRAVEAFRPKAEPYKITLDRGLQLRIAPDGKRTLLVRYTVKGSNTERQYRRPQEYGDAPGQLKLSAACAEAGRIPEPPRVTKGEQSGLPGPFILANTTMVTRWSKSKRRGLHEQTLSPAIAPDSRSAAIGSAAGC